MILNRYVGRLLDIRFEVTRTKLNFVLFDMEMEIDLRDMEVVASFSFDKDIHNKIGTHQCQASVPFKQTTQQITTSIIPKIED